VNRRAYAFGVVGVAIAMATTVLTRTYADALFLSGWGSRGVPVLLGAQALGFVLATLAYGAVTRRLRPVVVDPIVSLIMVGLILAARDLAKAGHGPLLVLAVTLMALSSLSSLAAWNAVTQTVRGRTARRFLPRAGAAATLGAVVAGFGGSALVRSSGVERLPLLIAALVALTLAAGLLLGRALTAQPLPPLAPAKRASKTSGFARTLVTWLVVAALAEAAVGAVAELLFKSSLADTYGKDQIAAFLATYQGATNLCVLVLQVFAVPRVLASRSLATSSSVHPILLGAALLTATIAPLLVVVVFARALDQVLKFSLSRASQEVALSPLSPPDAARWKVLLRGGATQAGAALVALIVGVGLPSLVQAHRAWLAGLGVVLGVGWLWAVRRAGRAYLAALAATLGMRRLSLDGERASDAALDRDGFRALVELAADADPGRGRVGQALLAEACRRGGELVPHLGHERPAVRQVVYSMLERAPDPRARAALGRQVVVETDAAALTAGLFALSAYGDGAAHARARAIVDGDPAGVDAAGGGELQAAARVYLASLGGEPAEAVWQVFLDLLARDGARAARLGLAEVRRGRRRAGDLEAALDEAIAAADPQRRREACRAAAAAARELPTAPLVRALAVGEPAAAGALREADGPGLATILRAAQALGGEVGVRARVRLARALRGSPAVEAGPALVNLLTDGDASVREAAARSLGKLVRERRVTMPEAALATATARELDRLTIYVEARAPAGARPPLHEQELGRQLELALEQVLTLVALAGNPTTVAAVSRRLRGDDERERRGALDLLQEVARGDTRGRMLTLVEALLTPPPPRSAVEIAASTAAVTAVDPWFRTLTDRSLGAAEDHFAALRKTRLFDEVPGQALAELARVGSVIEVAAGRAVVHEGDPGDALYVVLDGRLRTRRGELILGPINPGDAFGELALVDGQARTATVEVEPPASGAAAPPPARLLCVPREPFLAVLAAQPELGLSLLRSLARWLRSPLPRGGKSGNAGAAVALQVTGLGLEPLPLPETTDLVR
jgi:hypothetical protein